MDRGDAGPWTHSHAFGTAGERAGERRTRWVVALTLAMMVAEIVAGTAFGSMALLADGWHMGTHAAALGVAVFAYVYARRHASDPRYSFGTGKVGALGGFASAVGLAVVALLVLWESLARLAEPVAIRFDHAIAVAVAGLLVNLGSALLLRDREHLHGRGEHDHAEAHGHADDRAHGPAPVHRDHNLRGAYLHVLADALTSLLAIVALLAGKLLGWAFMDPLMGVAGSIVIARWSFGLLRDSAAVLLDAEVAPERRARIREAVERGGDASVSDLHVWRVGPRHLAAIVAVVADRPEPPDAYRRRLSGMDDLVHVTVEVNARDAGRDAARRPQTAGVGRSA
jgi:cation diffusion facilitator family transporter